MGRLVEMLTSRDGLSQLELCGSLDEQGRGHLSGRLRASVVMTCQRCLRDLTVSVDAKLHFVLLASDDEAAACEQDEEPLIMAPGDTLDLATLVEDEVILALPIVARHTQDAECILRDRCYGPKEVESPFAALSELLARKGTESKE
jgi:uncharacterized protein